MLDSSTSFGDLFPGDQFDSDKLACAGSKRYIRLSPTFEKGTGGYANAVELNTGEPALFQPEDRVTLVR